MRIRGDSRELSPEEYSERVGKAMTKQVHSLAVAWQQSAIPAPPEDEFVQAVLTLPALARVDTDLDEQIGPFYDTAGVQKVLGGISKQAVEARRRKASILALRTSDGKFVYPVFQFAGGAVDSALLPAIRALGSSPAWSVALWFVTANDDLDEMSPLKWARAELPSEAIETSARRTAAEWR
ncbi:hypothetical protein [Flexivirga sp.]|uniref:hypothetical protein n=1 Tax=Flexivirga sp. TaxID=1962927 RepID=UPI003F7CFED8